jgi:hypothetical protein
MRNEQLAHAHIWLSCCESASAAPCSTSLCTNCEAWAAMS